MLLVRSLDIVQLIVVVLLNISDLLSEVTAVLGVEGIVMDFSATAVGIGASSFYHIEGILK